MNRFVLAVVTSFLCAGVAQAQVTEEDLANDATSVENVLTNGMGRGLQRFSPLETLNRANVDKLMPAWAFSLGGEKQRGQESQPIIYDGVMYITGSYSRLFAIDIAAGKELWQYDARLPEGILPCCDVINRGAAIYGDNVYFGTLDARIVALNRKTGDVVWNKKIADYKEGYSYTAAPLIVNGLVITGNSGGEFGVVGEVQARDAETGELVWTRPTIEGHMGTFQGKESTMTGVLNATWPGDLWKTGGGATWLGGSYDQDTDTLIFGAGNPSPWNSWLRGAGSPEGTEGDNLYAASRLGIDPATGEIKWHFQTTPREGWDFDGVNEVVPFVDKDGNQRFATADRNEVRQRLAFREEHHLGRGHRCERSPDLQRGSPSRRPRRRRRWREGPAGLRRAVLSRWQELDADGLQPADRPVLRPFERVGHGHLERADRLQEGRGVPRRRLHHQAAVR
jgi:alcohol dehydrogenase (cytochrome c)